MDSDYLVCSQSLRKQASGDSTGMAKSSIGVPSERHRKRKPSPKDVDPRIYKFAVNRIRPFPRANMVVSLPNLKNAQHLVERVESAKLVFRVFDSCSRRSYNPDTGFIAHVNHPLDLSDTAAVERSIENHLHFNNTKPTPWVSATRRWLWAVWEANRRANTTSIRRTNIRIAVIDLDECFAANEGSPIRALGYLDLPFIHALDGLKRADERYRRFADASDEILIYHQVPASAVISIWSFNSHSISSIPSRFTHPLPPRAISGWPLDFGSTYWAVACGFLNDKQNGAWNAEEMGALCAVTALALLEDAYNRVARSVEKVVRRQTRVDSRNQASSKPPQFLIRQARFTYPYPFSQADVISTVHYTMNELVQLPDPFCRKAIEPIVAQEIRCLAHSYQARTSSKRMYRKFLAHKDTFMDQVMAVIRDSALVIQARHAHHELNRFLSLALEMARTVPLGLMDRLDITDAEWRTMKRFMLQKIRTKLTPLENKLLPLVNGPWIGMICDPQGEPEIDPGELAKRRWMRSERAYPKWWEECATRAGTVNHRPAARLY